MRATYIHILVWFSLFGKGPTFRSPTVVRESHSRSDGAAIFEQSLAIHSRFRPYFMHLHAVCNSEWIRVHWPTCIIFRSFRSYTHVIRLCRSTVHGLNVGQPVTRLSAQLYASFYVFEARSTELAEIQGRISAGLSTATGDTHPAGIRGK